MGGAALPSFKLEIDLAGHVNKSAPTAHHHLVAQLLDQAKQAFASGSATSGELKLAAPNVPTKTLGSWEYLEA
jgi:hypothetical protein